MLFHNARVRDLLGYTEQEMDGFDTRKFWCDLDQRKPPRGARLHVEPSRAMYVGDRPETDIGPAKAVGLKTAHYRGAHGRYSDRPADPPADHEVELLTELRPILAEVYGLPVRA